MSHSPIGSCTVVVARLAPKSEQTENDAEAVVVEASDFHA